MSVILVCGGREFIDKVGLAGCLQDFNSHTMQIEMLIQGGARGADTLAKEWAESRGIHSATVDALWDYYGKGSAGPFRNRAMTLLQPRYCVAFPGGRGTDSMIQICNELQIPVWGPYRS